MKQLLGYSFCSCTGLFNSFFYNKPTY